MNIQSVLNEADHRRKKMRYLEEALDWDRLKYKKVLDVGAAYGIWTVKALQEKAEVVATGPLEDDWKKQFDIYCNSYGFYNIPYLKWDIQKARNRKFDIILFFDVMQYLKEPEKALDNLFRMAQNEIWMEVAIASPITKPGYYYPTFEELSEQIKSRGGFIRNFIKARRGQYPRAIVEVLV